VHVRPATVVRRRSGRSPPVPRSWRWPRRP